MSDLLEGLLDDLRAEGDQLSATVERLGPDGWQNQTPAPGWTVATQVAHFMYGMVGHDKSPFTRIPNSG